MMTKMKYLNIPMVSIDSYRFNLLVVCIAMTDVYMLQ